MNRLPTLLLGLALLVCGRSGAVEWEAVVPGVEHGRILRDGLDAHAVRVDLDAACVAVVATPAADRGLTDTCRRGRGRQICDAALYHIMSDGIEGLHLRCSRVLTCLRPTNDIRRTPA